MIKLRLDIENKYKNVLKEKKDIEIKTLRLIKSAIKDKEIALRSKENKGELSEESIAEILQGMIKRRKESIEMFLKGGREQLVDLEKQEIEIIKSFLPKQLTEEETKEVIKNIIKENNFNSIKDMGKIMHELKSKYFGKIDLSLAGKLSKEILNQ